MLDSTQMMQELDDCFVRTAVNIAKYYVDKEEKEKTLTQLRNTLKENCIEIEKMRMAEEIKERLEHVSELEPDRKVEDITKEYNKAISEIKIDPSKDNRLLEFDRQIEGISQSNGIIANSTVVDDSDADLHLTSHYINVIDPISKMRMTNPVKNAVCGHIYDKESLTAMLKKNKNTRCPVMGCTSTAYIDLSQCRIDVMTKMYLEKNPA
ncbi:E3 SUMO-protein ligase NSE2-like [Linepithema humile]|uniref:E3 SUMO-protein ligase NSE2-like n=1 Tax=Linepithema humile TaxID=83485 RepID=UPI0006230E9D|nr:PREDICTED: E3 SUMO-protein ligase NSE2-like [Linepithema humile]